LRISWKDKIIKKIFWELRRNNCRGGQFDHPLVLLGLRHI
jgi:hypothetical protein